MNRSKQIQNISKVNDEDPQLQRDEYEKWHIAINSKCWGLMTRRSNIHWLLDTVKLSAPCRSHLNKFNGF